MAVFCVTSLFSYEFIVNDYSEEFFASKSQYKSDVSKLKEAREALVSIQSESNELKNYLIATDNKVLSKKEYFKQKEREQFFGFANKKIFLAEFGPMLAFLIYILFNLIRAFYKEKKHKGIILLHTSLLTGPIFYMYWIFQPFQDVSKPTYYAASILSTIIISIGVYFISKYRRDDLQNYRENLMEVARFTFQNTKPEKREEMVNMIEKVARSTKMI